MPSAAFASFSYRSFSYFWFGGLTANSARWFQYVALPAVIWELTHSPGWVGFAGFAQFLPMALIAPVSGMLADRFPRRNVLMLSQSLMGAVAVILALVWFQGVRSPAVYVLLAAMSGLTGGLNLPVWQAFVSELVPRELLLNAVTLNSAQFNSSRVVGPMLGGITVAAAGPGVAFMVSAGGSLIVLLALIRVQSRKAAMPGAVIDMRLVRNTLAVARYVRARSGLVVSFGAVALIGFFGLPIQVLTVVFAEDVFDRGPGGYGLMLTVIGAGAVATTPVIASMGGRVPRSRIQRSGLVVYGSSVLALSVAPTFVLFLVPLVFVGAAHLASASALNTTVQLQVDEERRDPGAGAVHHGAHDVEPSGAVRAGPVDRAFRRPPGLRHVRGCAAGGDGRAPGWGLAAPHGHRDRRVFPRGGARGASDHPGASPLAPAGARTRVRAPITVTGCSADSRLGATRYSYGSSSDASLR